MGDVESRVCRKESDTSTCIKKLLLLVQRDKGSAQRWIDACAEGASLTGAYREEFSRINGRV